MRDLVGVVLTFTRLVPDGAGMSRVETEWCYGRSVLCVASPSLKVGYFGQSHGTKIGCGDIEW